MHKLSRDGVVTYTVKWKGKEWADPVHNSHLKYEDFHSDTIIHEYCVKLDLFNPHMIQKRENKAIQAQKRADYIAKIIQKPIEVLKYNSRGHGQST